MDDPNFRQWAVLRLQHGLSLRALSPLVGMSASTLARIEHELLPADENGNVPAFKSRGLDGKVRPSRRGDTTARDRRIRAMRNSGHSVRDIAQAVECSVGTVHRIIAKSGS